MQHRVKKYFVDRHTGQPHQPGETLELSDERAEELRAAGVLAAPRGKRAGADAEDRDEE